jgi:hypothetical protein
MADIVECHSGFAYAEKPTALTWEGQPLEITSILDQWRLPGQRCFRVEASDGQVFELSYGEREDEWHIHQP